MLEFMFLTRSDLKKKGSTLESDAIEFREPLAPGGTINLSWGTENMPAGAWISVKLSVCIDGKWSGWFRIANWTQQNTDKMKRKTFGYQDGQFGRINVDTYENTSGGHVTDCRVRIDLHGKAWLTWVSVQAADRRPGTHRPLPMSRSVMLNVPMRSQYSVKGGEVFCGPTSALGVLRSLNTAHGEGIEDLVRDIWDEGINEKGTGTWPFIAAAMGARLRKHGIGVFVRNFSSLTELIPYLAKGLPPILSISWDNGSKDPRKHLLPGGNEKTGGHLLVLGGRTSQGDAILVDPATSKNKKDFNKTVRAVPWTMLDARWEASKNRTAIVPFELAAYGLTR